MDYYATLPVDVTVAHRTAVLPFSTHTAHVYRDSADTPHRTLVVRLPAGCTQLLPVRAVVRSTVRALHCAVTHAVLPHTHRLLRSFCALPVGYSACRFTTVTVARTRTLRSAMPLLVVTFHLIYLHLTVGCLTHYVATTTVLPRYYAVGWFCTFATTRGSAGYARIHIHHICVVRLYYHAYGYLHVVPFYAGYRTGCCLHGYVLVAVACVAFGCGCRLRTVIRTRLPRGCRYRFCRTCGCWFRSTFGLYCTVHRCRSYPVGFCTPHWFWLSSTRCTRHVTVVPAATGFRSHARLPATATFYRSPVLLVRLRLVPFTVRLVLVACYIVVVTTVWFAHRYRAHIRLALHTYAVTVTLRIPFTFWVPTRTLPFGFVPTPHHTLPVTGYTGCTLCAPRSPCHGCGSAVCWVTVTSLLRLVLRLVHVCYACSSRSFWLHVCYTHYVWILRLPAVAFGSVYRAVTQLPLHRVTHWLRLRFCVCRTFCSSRSFTVAARCHTRLRILPIYCAFAVAVCLPLRLRFYHRVTALRTPTPAYLFGFWFFTLRYAVTVVRLRFCHGCYLAVCTGSAGWFRWLPARSTFFFWLVMQLLPLRSSTAPRCHTAYTATATAICYCHGCLYLRTLGSGWFCGWVTCRFLPPAVYCIAPHTVLPPCRFCWLRLRLVAVCVPTFTRGWLLVTQLRVYRITAVTLVYRCHTLPVCHRLRLPFLPHLRTVVRLNIPHATVGLPHVTFFTPLPRRLPHTRYGSVDCGCRLPGYVLPHVLGSCLGYAYPPVTLYPTVA